VTRTAYLDTSIFVEMGARKSKYKRCIRDLLKELEENKVRIYTSMVTVQEMAVATYRAGATAKDVYGDINSIARIYNLTKEVALTAAKNEAGLKDMAETEAGRRDPKKGETEEQKLERICQNRRRKWDCFHIATAQAIGCAELYSTDHDLRKRPDQLGIRSLKALDPCDSGKTIRGPLFDKAGHPKTEK
jgi:predicted nucleic acid-binding protein